MPPNLNGHRIQLTARTLLRVTSPSLDISKKQYLTTNDQIVPKRPNNSVRSPPVSCLWNYPVTTNAQPTAAPLAVARTEADPVGLGPRQWASRRIAPASWCASARHFQRDKSHPERCLQIRGRLQRRGLNRPALGRQARQRSPPEARQCDVSDSASGRRRSGNVKISGGFRLAATGRRRSASGGGLVITSS
jgi:hypothetical protein